MSQQQSNDLFISFLPEDKQFVLKLLSSFRDSGLSSWNEVNAITLGSSNNNKAVEQGILNAHNFVFVMSPLSIQSEACHFAIAMAHKLKKPIVTVVAQKATVENETLFVPPVIERSKWINFENSVYTDKYSELLTEITNDSDIKSKHSRYLKASKEWKAHDKKTGFLLSGKSLVDAEKWLKHSYENRNLFGPTYQQAEYICESRKHIEGGQTDIFFTYSNLDEDVVSILRESIMGMGFTSWNKRTEIATICKFTHSVEDLIYQSDSLLFFMSHDSLRSLNCIEELKLAQRLRKKIIIVKLDDIPSYDYPDNTKEYPLVDLTVPADSDTKTVLHFGIKGIRRTLEQDYHDYKLYKDLLIRTRIWQRTPEETNILLKGYQLVRAERWLQSIKTKGTIKPLQEIEQYIDRSSAKQEPDIFDAYFSYATEDYLMARRLRRELQSRGHNVWFDPQELKETEAINASVKQAIIKANHVIILLSPESISTPHVKREIKTAVDLEKSVMPIMVETFTPASMPKELSHLQPFDGRIKEKPISHVVEKIERHLNHNRQLIQNHTRWLAPALKWEENGRRSEYLLKENQAREAYDWLELHNKERIFKEISEPQPLSVQSDLIINSILAIRNKEKKQKYRYFGILAALAISILIIFLVYLKSFIAEKNYELVGTQLLAFEAQTTLEKDPTLSLRLAEAGYKFNPTSKHTYSGLLNSFLANKPLYTKIFESQETVHAASFSSDGRSILIASGDRNAYLLDLNGQTKETFIHGDIVYSAKFSKDGNYILSAGQDGMKIWNKSGDEINSIDFDAELFDASFSPSQDLIAAVGADTKISLYSFQGEFIKDIEAHDDVINLVHFSPSGKRLVSLSEDASIGIWDAVSGKKIKKLSFRKTPKYVRFAQNDSTLIIAGSKATTGIWDIHSGKRIKELKEQHLGSHFIMQDNKHFITADDDFVIRCWNEEGKLLNEFKGHSTEIHTVAINPAGTLMLSASGKYGEEDNSARLWDLAPKGAIERKKRSTINSAAYSPDGKFFAISSNQKVEIRNPQGKSPYSINVKRQVNDVVFSSNGANIFTASDDNIIRRWTFKGKNDARYDSEHASVSSIDVSPDGKQMVSSGTDQVIALWDLRKKTSMPIIAHNEAVTHVKFSADGDRFITVSEDSTAKVWDSDGDLEFTLKGHESPVIWGDFSSNGKRIVTTGLDRKAILWNEDGEKIRELNKHTKAVTSACFSPDGKYLVTTGYDGKWILWTCDGEIVYEYKGESHTIEQQDLAVYSPRQDNLLVISRDFSSSSIFSVYKIKPENIIESINKEGIAGPIWELDAITKQLYNVLEE